MTNTPNLGLRKVDSPSRGGNWEKYDESMDILDAAGGGSSRLDQILDPTADKTFALTDFDLHFTGDIANGTAVRFSNLELSIQFTVDGNSGHDGIGIDLNYNDDTTFGPYGVIGIKNTLTVLGSNLETNEVANYDCVAVTGFGSVGADSIVGYRVQSPLVVGGPISNFYGLKVADITAAANNWAIKTGLGLVELGDALKIHGNVGFYNHAPAAKPTVTGSRGANAALASLLTALAGLGLLTDSTS